MGRRKKEPESVHRDCIAAAAERLFRQKSIQGATMDDIAKEAGYSKATLYVYFANKEEIVGILVLRSMKLLKDCLSRAVFEPGVAKEKYDRICRALLRYQEQYPLYYTLTLGEINVDFENGAYQPVEKEIFDVGEQINGTLSTFIREETGIGKNQPEQQARQTVFWFWATLSGLIQTAVAKQAYLERYMGITKQQFLEDGFNKLYQVISAEDAKS
ncbi:MAG TPA: TetR/AcrR family transcriptional regulator [Clostridia bacterium]|nr:TetR/AcrR family transcriptional regulator [Clostridia bacterium]